MKNKKGWNRNDPTLQFGLSTRGGKGGEQKTILKKAEPEFRKLSSIGPSINLSIGYRRKLNWVRLKAIVNNSKELLSLYKNKLSCQGGNKGDYTMNTSKKKKQLNKKKIKKKDKNLPDGYPLSLMKNYWLDLVKSGIMKLVKINFIMESPLKTIKEILKELNPPEGKGDWYAIEGIWAFGKVKVKDNKAQGDFSRMIVVKLFKNKKTGEIKTYLAKNLDTPERESL